MLKVLEQPAPRELTHQRLFARIGKFLTEHGLCPSPENYGLVYQLVVESDSPMAREVNKMISDGVRLSQPAADRIRDEYGLDQHHRDDEHADEHALHAATQLLEQVTSTVEQARAATESYGRDLEQGAAELESSGQKAGLDNLLRITGAILERTRTAEQRLAKAETEAQALRQQLTEVEAEARRDPLTGLANRRAFEHRCRELDQSGVQVAVAICDLDHFKLINDSHGHAVGDRVLKMMARRLEKYCAGHMVSRLGGEEFVILFENHSTNEAADMIDAARRALSRREFVLRSSGERLGQITFSAGISLSYKGVLDGLKRADELLYEAKNAGRDQVRVDE